jgi:muramoyltetrapeptide carboxypeptidase
MTTNSHPLLKPQRLAPGQTVGVIAPAYTVGEDDRIRIGLETVESLGFRVKPGQHLFRRHGYFAGTDEQRAADLNALFADPEVAGIICLRGGYGASRTLPHLDFDLIRRNPKALIGYSDITSLLNPIQQRTGLVTFHGPIADQTYTPYTLAQFQKVVQTPEAPTVLAAAPPFEAAPGRIDRQNRAITLVPGKARGRLVGGNLTLLAHLAGTPYAPDYAGAIVFFEDVQETVHRIDRMLTQLWLAGALQQAAGLVFGKFTEIPPSTNTFQFSLEQVLADRAQAVGIPAVRGLMIGHVEDQATLPIGCKVELDADARTLTLLETAVS